MQSNLDFISKITQNANSDLREYTAHVKRDLIQLQNQSVVEISQLKNEVQELQSQIDTSIGVLDKIANIVGTFQTDLENISTQVLSLQNQSNQMNVSHKNRKILYQELDGFLKGLLISPNYIQYLREAEINEEYFLKIDRLDHVLKNLKALTASKTEESHSPAVQQIRKITQIIKLFLGPQIEKINSAVCTRIRNLFTQKFQALSKPKTNISIIQQSILKFSPLMVYLRNHNQYTYVEMTNIYSETMHKIYFTLLKSYITDSSKLIAEIVTQHDLIGITGNYEDPAGINSFASLSKGLKDRTCDGNENILNQIESDPIDLHSSTSTKKKYNIQEIFRSQNHLIINTITAELIFIGDFFSLQVQQCSHMFKIIFNRIVTFYIDWLKTFIQFSCHDCTGLLLMTLINQCNKERLEQRKFPILQYYFDKISQVIQPRFNAAFQIQMQSLKKSSAYIQTTIQKQMNKAGVGGRIASIAPNVVLPFIQKYVQFVIPIYSLLSLSNPGQIGNQNNQFLAGGFNGEMINMRLNQIKGLVMNSLYEIGGKVFKHDKNVATIFIINNINFVKSGFDKIKSSQLIQIVKEMTRETQQKMDGFINALVGGYFHDLQSIVKRFGGNALNDSGSDSGGRASLEKQSGDEQEQDDEGPFDKKRQKIGEAQIHQFDDINLQFQQNWNLIMRQIQDYLHKTVASGNQIDKIILRRVAKQVFRNYTVFADLMKSVRPITDISVMQAQKSILVDLKNYERSIK